MVVVSVVMRQVKRQTKPTHIYEWAYNAQKSGVREKSGGIHYGVSYGQAQQVRQRSRHGAGIRQSRCAAV